MSNYKYYNGESKNPYECGDLGKSFWWCMEYEAVLAGDKKEADKLSETMVHYIREKMWQGDAHSDTDWGTALKRATELYVKGLWSRNYICDVACKIPSKSI